MVTVMVPCELDEVDAETENLREKVLDFDDLMDLCMMTALSPKDLKELNDLYAYLLSTEHDFWVGASWAMVDMIKEHCNLDFPMIRYITKTDPRLYEGEMK